MVGADGGGVVTESNALFLLVGWVVIYPILVILVYLLDKAVG